MSLPVPSAGPSPWRNLWHIRPDTTYLNHGSFGPPPREVIEARRQWQARLDEQPMDFYVRQFTPAWLAARERLANFVGARPENLVFCEDATAAMNIVAGSFPLTAGDEVLLTDHEYGAVQRIWERACRRAGAHARTVRLPLPIAAVEPVVEAIAAAVTARTKLVVASHITSATAVTLPVAEIGAALRERGVAFCIDGPHAVAQLPLALEALGADFYCASLHKWLCAPFGSGFLHVASPWQAHIEPPLLSWGRIAPETPQTWWDEFVWSGTRDPSAYLAAPAAIDFLERLGCTAFRTYAHDLAQYARIRLLQLELTDQPPIVPDDPRWYTAMAHVPLPAGDSHALQRALWEQERIEVPIVTWNGQRWIRVSCHFYNDRDEIDRLVAAVQRLLAAEPSGGSRERSSRR